MRRSLTVLSWSHGSPMRPPVLGLTHLTPLIGVRVRPLGETNGRSQTGPTPPHPVWLHGAILAPGFRLRPAGVPDAG